MYQPMTFQVGDIWMFDGRSKKEYHLFLEYIGDFYDEYAKSSRQKWLTLNLETGDKETLTPITGEYWIKIA